MTRRTSVDVYKRIESEGLLSRKRWEVYDLIFREGPLTGSEVNSRLGSKSGHKRLSELQERKLICEVGVRPCTVTGESVIQWDVTDNLPVDPSRDRGSPTREQLREFLKVFYEVKARGDLNVDSFAVLSWLEDRAGTKISETPQEPEGPPEWLSDWFGPQ